MKGDHLIRVYISKDGVPHCDATKRGRFTRSAHERPALLRVGRGWTRSNTVKRAYASLGEGRGGHVRAPDPDIRVESRSNRRKRGQTRAKPWFAKEEANCMYIRGLEDTYAG